MTGSPSPFKELEVVIRLSLLPEALHNVRGHIRAQLLQQLLRYNEDFGGVIVSFSKIAPKSHCGQLVCDEPHIHVDVGTTAYVFAPSLTTELIARTTKVSATHISLLAYGIFNVTIAAADVGSAHVISEDGADWICRHERDSDGAQDIRSGTHVRLRVKKTHHAEGLLAIDGELMGVLNTTPASVTMTSSTTTASTTSMTSSADAIVGDMIPMATCITPSENKTVSPAGEGKETDASVRKRKKERKTKDEKKVKKKKKKRETL
uniref:RPA43 OB domain-containing protein n=1 Tax=Octactis speculum TaxID=3111310 RepID=A0A7S2ARY2_9STRA